MARIELFRASQRMRASIPEDLETRRTIIYRSNVGK